jgi:molecular chaperone GrpE
VSDASYEEGDQTLPGGAAPVEEAAPLPEDDGGTPAPGDDDVARAAGATPSVEDILGDLERVTAERDAYLALAQTKQAELENMRKRMMKQQADEVTRRSASIVKSLLPVLDAFDYGVAHGDESIKALQGQLLGALGQEGLERVGEPETPFDPEQHEAVSHEPGDESHQVVSEVLRAGYRWQGHLVRPAMVRVRG